MVKNLQWSIQEDQIIKNYYPCSTKEQMEILLPIRSWRVIKDRACKLKIKQISSNRYISKSNIENLLSSSNEAYYWVGFLLADGYFSPQGEISISLSSKDENHLIQFAIFLDDSNAALTKLPKVNAVRYTVCSKRLAAQVRSKFNILDRKTENPPDITTYIMSDNQLISLFCGFIDGDGCITSIGKCTIECHKAWNINLQYLINKIYAYYKTTRNNVLMSERRYARGMLSISIMKKLKFTATNLSLPLLERKWNRVV